LSPNQLANGGAFIGLPAASALTGSPVGGYFVASIFGRRGGSGLRCPADLDPS